MSAGLAPKLSLSHPFASQGATCVKAIGDVVAVIVATNAKAVGIAHKGAVQFRIQSGQDSLVADAAAPAALLGQVAV